MFDSVQPRLRLVELVVEAEESPAEVDTLRERCLHPADAWVLNRRASRPAPPPCRLPAVAPVG